MREPQFVIVSPNVTKGKYIDRMLWELAHREFSKYAEKDLGSTPDWGGFRGILSMFDEMELFVPSWTPKQFNLMWDSFSHRAKVNYVKNLITR